MVEPFTYGNPGGVEEEIETVRAIYAAFARRDLDGALEHIAGDCAFLPAGTARQVGRNEPYRGHDGVRQYFADAARVWAELTLHADDIRATGGGVVVFGSIEGVAGGQRMRRRVLWTWQLRDGKAVAMRVSDLGE